MTGGETSSLLTESAKLAGRLDAELTVSRLEAARARLTKQTFGIVVVGLTGEGKSSLVNALLGGDLLPAGPGASTRHHVAVTGGPTESASVYVVDSDDPASILPADLAEYATAEGNPANEKGVRGVSVQYPCDFLRDGVGIIDTPGSGAAGPPTLALTLATLHTADAVLFVTSAAAPLSRTEVELLLEIKDRVDTVVIAATKTDVYSSVDEIISANRKVLAGHPSLSEIPFVAVSAHLAEQARAAMGEGKTQLAEAAMQRSNLLELREELRPHGIGRRRVKEANAASETLAALAQLEIRIAERLSEARAEPETVQRLEAMQQRLHDLASTSARWRVDMDYWLRNLTADFDAQAEARIKALDTRYSAFAREGHTDLISRIEQDMTESLAALWLELTQFLDDWFIETLVAATEELIDGDDLDIPFGALEVPASLSDSIAASAAQAIEGARTTIGEKTMAAYPGVLAASLPSSMATLGMGAFGGAVSAALAPVLVGVGVVAGGVMIRVRQRQSSAASTQRQALDLVRSTLADVRRTLSRQLAQETASLRRELEHEISERIAIRRRETDRALRETRELARSDVEARRRRVGELQELDRTRAALVVRAEALRSGAD
ncbi:MAG: dynamin family protein [Acidimicrobiales bacterium]|nr:dynamin family protein [Acidimicrobiales bacterium]